MDPDPIEIPLLGDRFLQALQLAYRLHNGQQRKGTRVPYISHLLAVTSLVLENGGDEEQAIAALLHDAVEDQGGLPVLQEIRDQFGERVARIVDGCTDAYSSPKPPWHERKQRYLQHLQNSGAETALVSLADKVHNARSILYDLRRRGPSVWERFRGGLDGSLWYYHSLVEAFYQVLPGPLTDELARVVAEIEILSRPANDQEF